MEFWSTDGIWFWWKFTRPIMVVLVLVESFWNWWNNPWHRMVHDGGKYLVVLRLLPYGGGGGGGAGGAGADGRTSANYAGNGGMVFRYQQHLEIQPHCMVSPGPGGVPGAWSIWSILVCWWWRWW